jgi:hypothetical protein
MKKFLFTLSFACALTLHCNGQGYQPQYPYDPYNTAPQPSPQAYRSQPQGGGYANATSSTALLSYGYLSGRYTFNDFKTATKFSTGSGFGADLGVQLLKPLFLHFGVNWLNANQSGGGTSSSFNMTSLTAAGGAYVPLSDRFHLFAEVGARYDVVSGAPILLTKDAFSIFVRPGIRWAVTDKLELEAELLFNSTDNLNDRVFGLNAFYSLFSIVDVGLGADFTSDLNSYHTGVRVRW